MEHLTKIYEMTGIQLLGWMLAMFVVGYVMARSRK